MKQALVLCAVAIAVLVVLAVPFADAPFYAHVLSPHGMTLLGSADKLVSLGAGAWFASRASRAFDKGSTIQSAWALMRAWFVGFFVGQLALTVYQVRLGTAPVPSVGDPFFLLGYVAVTVATVRFFAGYRASGFALGTARGHIIFSLVASALFALTGVIFLGPLLHGDAPLLTRLINVAYPALDFVLLVPTLVLLRMTWRFRGGLLWSVWATLLVGVVFFTAGDILFAIPGSNPLTAALADAGFLLGYSFAAAGAGRQIALTAD